MSGPTSRSGLGFLSVMKHLAIIVIGVAAWVGMATAVEPALPPGLAAALARLAAPEESERLAGARDLGRAARDELAPVAAELTAALEQEPSRLVRERLAWDLGLCGSGASSFLPRLVAAWRRETDREVRRTLLRSLGLIQPTTREVVDLLSAEIASPLHGFEAVPALGALGPAARPATPTLVAVLGEPDSSKRISAAIALGAILESSPLSPGGDDPLPAAVGALARTLGDPHLTARQEAAKALGRIGPAAAAAVPALIAVLELEDGESADHALHASAAWALGEMGKIALPAAPALRRCFSSDPDPFTRKAAEAALRKLGVAPAGSNSQT